MGLKGIRRWVHLAVSPLHLSSRHPQNILKHFLDLIYMGSLNSRVSVIISTGIILLAALILEIVAFALFYTALVPAIIVVLFSVLFFFTGFSLMSWSYNQGVYNQGIEGSVGWPKFNLIICIITAITILIEIIVGCSTNPILAHK